MNAVKGNTTVRVPKAGEMVAAQLRRQIVLGELKEGDQLPSESVLMEEFYTNLWQKKLSRLEALRQAQLSIMDDPNFGDGGNPRLWAAWWLV